MMDILLAIIAVLTLAGLAVLLVELYALRKMVNLIDQYIEQRFDLMMQMHEVDNQRLRKLEEWRRTEIAKKLKEME